MLPPLLRDRPDFGGLVLKATVLLLALAYFCLFEPADWLICPFRSLTGLLCPLCGMTHALCAMGHGEVRRAVELNAVSPVIFAMFLGGFVWCVSRMCGWRLPKPRVTQAQVFLSLMALLFVNWVWRLVVAAGASSAIHT